MAITFGSFTFPRGFSVADDSGDSEVSSNKLVRADGGTRPNSTLEAKKITIRGGIIGKPGNTMRQQLDALKAALNAGKQNLSLESDRFYREVQKVRLSSGFGPTHYGRIVDTVQITFEAGDPFQYAATATESLTNAISSSPTNKTLTVADGNAPAMPELRLTVGGSGAITLAATITNTTTGESFTLAGAVTGGDVIKVNSLDQTVLIGTTDKMALFEGVFPKLALGANTITIAYTSGTITNLAGVWRSRWY
jgi:phage-related protein